MSELEIWNELGNLYFDAGAHDKAAKAYLKAIELDQESVQSYHNLATIYTRQGRYADAIPLYQKAIELLSNSDEKALLLTRMGDAYREIDDQESAVASYMRAGELDPESAAPAAAPSPAEGKSPPTPSIDATPPPAPDITAAIDLQEPDTHDPTAPGVGGQPLGQATSPAGPGSSGPDASPPMDGDLAVETAVTRNETISRKANRLLTAGVMHWRRGDLEKAIDSLNDALDLASSLDDDPFEALCLNAIALVETDLERIDEAMQAYERAVALAPEQPFPWNNLGKLYSQVGLYQKALEAFQKAIKFDSEDAISWNGLGDVYYKLGRNEDAISAYQLGNLFEKQGRHQDSITVYQMVLKSDPANLQAWNELGNIHLDNGSYEEAIRAYLKVIELSDVPREKALLWMRVGDAYARLEDEENAALARQKAVELDPQAAASYEALPHLGEGANRVEEPLDQAEDAPDDPPAAAPVPPPDPGEGSPSDDSFEDPEPEATYWIFGPSAAVGKVLSPDTQTDPAAKPARDRLADVDLMTIEPAPVLTLAQFTEMLPAENDERAPEDPAGNDLEAGAAPTAPAPGNPGISGEPETPGAPPAEGDESDTQPVVVEFKSSAPARKPRSIEDEITAYRRVTEINPRNDRAWDALGNMFLEVGLFEEALSAFERAIALEPNKEAYHYHLGLAYASRNRYAEAIKAIQKVVELNPEHTLAHCTLARYYRQVGQDSLAGEHLAVVRPSMEKENEYNRACFESICGNADEALELLKTALEKKQIQLNWVHNDPDLDFVRNDPRFAALTGGSGNEGGPAEGQP